MQKHFSPSPHIPTSSHLSNRLALITGASRGIGAAVAKRFAAEGAHVVLIARDSKGLEATDDAIRSAGGKATLVPLDLRHYDKIEIMAAMIAGRFGKLDILVGNAAALADLTPLPHGTPEDWDKVIGLNVTANWHLIRCFDMLLKASDAGRALFVTSGVTTHPSPYWGSYTVSKTALEAMVQVYAAENAKPCPRLCINLIDPGRVRTRMRAQAFPGEDAMTLPEPDSITDIFVKLASTGCKDTGKKFTAA